MVWTSFTRIDYARNHLVYASGLTDRGWVIIKQSLPGQPSRGRKRCTCLRRTLEAIFYVIQTGYAWRLLPVDFPRAVRCIITFNNSAA